MLIAIQDVPRAERHLLFCSDPRLTRPELDTPIPLDELGAVNRSLAALGEEVDGLTITDGAAVVADQRQIA